MSSLSKKEYQKRWREAHPGYWAARDRAWRKANPEYTKERSRKWRKENPEKVREYTRNYRLRKVYGLTVEEYEARLKAQKNRCAICQKKLTRPNLDHCHKTGKVRGFLCTSCNNGLGAFKDKPDLLMRAAEYLR